MQRTIDVRGVVRKTGFALVQRLNLVVDGWDTLVLATWTNWSDVVPENVATAVGACPDNRDTVAGGEWQGRRSIFGIIACFISHEHQ